MDVDAVIRILFIGLQYYSYNKNPIRLNPDRPDLGVVYANPVSGRKSISVHP